MQPQIRYARTADGLKIAYFALGSGLPLVVIPPNFAHAIEPEWQVPQLRSIAETSSQFLRYVRYDPRGVGLSDAYAGEFTVDALVLDVEAVADAVSPEEPILLWGSGRLGPISIAYAARHPDRVSKLVLWSTGANAVDVVAPSIKQLGELASVDWDLAMEASTQAISNFEEPEVARSFAAMSRAISPSGREAYVRFERDSIQWDVENLLPAVRCPTLVLHPALSQYVSVDNARGLAAGIADASLHLIDTASSLANHPDVLRVTGEFFFGEGLTAPRSRSSTSTVVVLFADIVNSTGLTEEWGDNVFRERAHALDGALRAVIERANGRTVEGKTLGDGVLATFLSANDALAAARRCARAGDEAGLPLHLGLHAGDVIREEGNVFGGAVNVAARVSALSAPSEILVSQTVRDLARTSSGVTFADRGEHDLKGVSDPVRVFAVAG